MIIDIHVHLADYRIFSPRFISGILDSIALPASVTRDAGEKLLNNALRDHTGTKLLAEMTRAGITKSCLLIADFGVCLGEAELSISDIHALHFELQQKHKDQFLIFAGVDPRRGKPGHKLLDRAFGVYRFAGLKIYPPCGFELDDPCMFPLYEICEAYGKPALTHTGPSLDSMRTERAFPDSLRNVCKRFPDLKIVLAHAGARTPEHAVLLASEHKSVYFDISAFQRDFKDPADLERRLRMIFEHTPSQVLFGTDWPLYSFSGSQSRWVSIIKNLPGLSSDEKDRLFFRNAMDLLGGEITVPSVLAVGK